MEDVSLSANSRLARENVSLTDPTAGENVSLSSLLIHDLLGKMSIFILTYDWLEKNSIFLLIRDRLEKTSVFLLFHDWLGKKGTLFFLKSFMLVTGWERKECHSFYRLMTSHSWVIRLGRISVYSH